MDYFCAAITENGFYNGFGDVFNKDRLLGLYIIKGASGVGKSTLMKSVALCCESRRIPFERIYCSSDTSSLDGVIVGDVGIIDGTPPHSADTTLPGAFDKLIDLGQFWDNTALSSKKEIIELLMKKKGEAFSSVLSLAKAYGVVFNERAKEQEGYLLKEDVELYVGSILRRKLKKAKRGKGEMRITSSFLGEALLPKAEKAYSLDADHCFGHYFLGRMKKLLEKEGIEFFWSPLLPSLERVETVYIPSISTLYTLHEGYRRIREKRFLSSPIPKFRELDDALDDISRGIATFRGRASKHHAALESIYAPTMDFSKVGRLTEELIAEIFGTRRE